MNEILAEIWWFIQANPTAFAFILAAALIILVTEITRPKPKIKDTPYCGLGKPITDKVITGAFGGSKDIVVGYDRSWDGFPTKNPFVEQEPPPQSSGVCPECAFETKDCRCLKNRYK